MTAILLIDDDPLITEPLTRLLPQHGYEVTVAHNGLDGLVEALKGDHAVVVLDVMMPDMDGWEVCRRLRQESGVPILMLTALGDEVDRILGLELGADDYLTKPFSTRELIARIKALLRRVALDKADVVETTQTVSGIEINFDRREVRKNGHLLTLRHKEFELLALLLSRPGQVFSRAEIFDAVWGTDWLGDTRTLDVHIRWLREKLEEDPGNPQLIQTIRGVGYRFVD
ncbi:MAG: response regulator transcription factor [Anaerolineales bacterium]|nr:response regulator transcription factor [Anaerolineales bacterium]MCB8960697.1 response regulator transcription factor [Ardenticatenales bacterium]